MKLRSVSESVAEDWERVGHIVAERIAELGQSYADLVRTSGVSDATWRKLRRGERVAQRPKLWLMAEALNWTPDSIERIARGDEPAPLTRWDGETLHLFGSAEQSTRHLRRLNTDDELRDVKRRLALVEEQLLRIHEAIRDRGARGSGE